MKKTIIRTICLPLLPLVALMAYGLSQDGGEKLSYWKCFSMTLAQWWVD